MVPEDSSASDDHLVAASTAGDEGAFTELIRRYKHRIFGLVSRFTQDPGEQDDICQDVFIQAFFKLKQFRRESPFEHWILRIATFKCYDYLRKRKREAGNTSVEEMLESGYEPTAAVPEAPHPHLEKLQNAMAKLEPQQRLVITLMALEERSVQEVSKLTGWSLANVKVRAFRARAELKKLLEKALS
jgi:RNA polymerase sigma-70 factor (ECF subfamily)